jgi:hypothetical protein
MSVGTPIIQTGCSRLLPVLQASAEITELWSRPFLLFYNSLFTLIDFFRPCIRIDTDSVLNTLQTNNIGRAIPQAVSRWLPTAEARVRSRVWSSGICGGQSGPGAGFLRVLRFPLPIFIPPIAQQSPSPIIWGWYNRPELAAVQGTQSHPTSNKK